MAKKGDVFCCDDCGLVVVVDEGCGCIETDLICCGEPMVTGKAEPAKKAKKAAPKAKAKPVAKKTGVKTKK